MNDRAAGPDSGESAAVCRSGYDESAAVCRSGCGACCIAPSITSPVPGMPEGKRAGVPCVQLDENLRCRIFGSAERPSFCASLRPQHEMCGASREEALAGLAALEELTRP